MSSKRKITISKSISGPSFVLNKIQSLLEIRDYEIARDLATENLKKYPDIVGFKKALAFCLGATGDLHNSKKIVA